jgi:predicted phosphodiesterase
MRSKTLAVISDIHGNLEAFKAVLSDIDRLELDRVICLGDSVGYGPEPEQVLKLLQSRNIPSLMGNHEWGLLDEASLFWFNPQARRSLLQNRELLTKESLAYLKSLPFNMSFNDCLLVHACPPDDFKTYLFEISMARFPQLFHDMPENVCMVGHTHELVLISYTAGRVTIAPLAQGVKTLDNNSKYIVNVGSVGQPRDGNNNAKYVIWNSESRKLEVRFIPYDISKTAEKIKALGLPRINADRLW